MKRLLAALSLFICLAFFSARAEAQYYNPGNEEFFRQAREELGFTKAILATTDRLTRNSRIGTANSYHPIAPDGLIHEGVQAYSQLGESGKNPWVAVALSALVPGLGKTYAGRLDEGTAAFLANSALGAVALDCVQACGPLDWKSLAALGLSGLFYLADAYGSFYSVGFHSHDLLSLPREENPALLDSLYSAVNDAGTLPSRVEAAFALADYLRSCGLYEQEMDVYNYIPMYALNAEQRKDLLSSKALCAYNMGDLDACRAFIEERGVQIGEAKRKNPWLAAGLTVAIPLGFLYVEKPLEGLLYTLGTVGSILWIVSCVESGAIVAAIIGGAYTLYLSYAGAHYKTQQYVQEYNTNEIRLLLQPYLRGE